MSFSDAELRQCEDFIVDLATKAGMIIAPKFYVEEKSFTEKTSKNDLVTQTDAAVERYLISAIYEKFPSHRFIGEETTSKSSSNLTDEPTWIIDPIDGTMNFIHGNPNICISIGLVFQKTVSMGCDGVIYNPIRQEMYSARLGGGAYKNGQPIRVSNMAEMANSLCLTGFGVNFLQEKGPLFADIIPKLHGVRSVGSIAIHMAQVASGVADVSFAFGCHCYDMAAGAIIVREAGGVVVHVSGAEFDVMSRTFLCAATRPLAAEMARHLEGHNLPIAYS